MDGPENSAEIINMIKLQHKLKEKEKATSETQSNINLSDSSNLQNSIPINLLLGRNKKKRSKRNIIKIDTSK